MKKTYVFLVLIPLSIVAGSWLSHVMRPTVAQPQKPEGTIERRSKKGIPKEIDSCFPLDYDPPKEVFKTKHANAKYYAVHAYRTSATDQPAGSAYFLFKADGKKCQEFLDGSLDTEWLKYIPFDAAVDLKVGFWKWTFGDATEEQVKAYLNTPFDFTDPIVFYPDDVAALKRLGHSLGSQATVVKDSKELNKIINLPSDSSSKQNQGA